MSLGKKREGSAKMQIRDMTVPDQTQNRARTVTKCKAAGYGLYTLMEMSCCHG